MSKIFHRISILALFFGLMAPMDATGQEAPAPSDSSAWKTTLVGKLAGSQAGFRNWAEGGVNTLAFSSGLDGRAEKMANQWSHQYELRLTFGMVKQAQEDFRKAEDVIRLRASHKHVGNGALNSFRPTLAWSARSQFAPGYNYEKNQFAQERELPQKVSDFLSPGVLTQALGMTYQYSEALSQRLGVGGKQTVVLIERLRELYNMDLDQQWRVEVGVEAYTDFEKEVFENVNVKSTLGLFAAFNQPEHPDLFWESLVAMKVNSWLQVNIEWAVLRDKDVSDKFQFKEIFSVGISYHFL